MLQVGRIDERVPAKVELRSDIIFYRRAGVNMGMTTLTRTLSASPFIEQRFACLQAAMP